MTVQSHCKMKNERTDNEDVVDLTWTYGKRLSVLILRYLKLEAIDKLSVVLTIVAVMGVIFSVGMTAVYCICMGIVKSLALAVGSETTSLFIVGGVLVALIVIFILLRRKFVTIPVIKALSKTFFADEAAETKEKAQ